MSKITVKILGTTAGVPTRNRGHAAIYIEYGHFRRFCCLFDCGEGTQRQLITAGVNMMALDHIFITHWHGDHCLGLAGLIDTLGFEGRTRPMLIHAPEIRKMPKCIGIIYPMGKFKVSGEQVNSRGSRIREVHRGDNFRIISVPVTHSIPAVAYAFIEDDRIRVDPEKAAEKGLPPEGEFYAELKEKGSVEIRGRRVKLADVCREIKGRKVVYSGDAEVCDNLKEIARGADLLIQDCTYMEQPGTPRPHSHASLPEVLDMGVQVGVKRMVLTHISRKYGAPDELREKLKEYPEFEIAEDFYTVVL